VCLPNRQSDSSGSASSPINTTLHSGALMLLACAGGPALIGVLGGLTASGLIGIGAGAAAIAACLAVPIALKARRRGANRAQPATAPKQSVGSHVA
jgi:hypothetical protein